MKFLCVLFSFGFVPGLLACDLCAIYNSGDTVGQFNSGFSFSIAEQYIPYRTTQLNGEEVHGAHPSYVDSSITHLAPAYNFSSLFGVSLNLPLTYLNFRRTDVVYSPAAPPVQVTEQGNELGIGDISLIGRLTVFDRSETQHGFVINILAGVKFPTGDASRVRSEVEQARIFESFLPPGTPHDPLGHSTASVHEHNLALGSGSYDGLFGLTASARLRRWFFNSQLQYYLRTQGESDFKYGDELMITGGPGFFVLANKSTTASLQLNATYDTMARDELLGRASNVTGSTAWYLGPFASFSWGTHLTGNAGIDLPLRIANKGFQSVPKYRIHAGLTWRF